ncbi:TrbC family F-type conjugative pilus assembly protein [Marinobacter goseongensis]|uniref:TrbC family F-type conjugative pilus assembly protein n=1 Tax=Marinobacter goseongensis TaxID=453838 RepID=UPI00200497E0|nr:TrbC family F-type conjugative pilus assembly protein [Marinobacter goseongensis]MCK7553315.1 hypothetical protein [Marinobacter goseongensis]
MPGRFSFFGLLLTFTSLGAVAQTPEEPFDFSAVQEKARSIQENAASYLDEETINQVRSIDVEQFRDELEGINTEAFERIASEGIDQLEGFGRFSKERIEATKQLMQERRATGDTASPLLHGRSETTVVFISSSLPRAQLREALLTIQKTPDTVGVVRGLLPGTTSIPETVLALKNLIDGADLDGVAPSVFIDPTLFSDNAVTTVPTIVHYDGRSPVARVSGLPNAEFLRSEVQDGQTGDLGTFGEVFEVVEVNLIDEMKRRAAALDGEEIMRNANNRFFDHQPRFTLPKAQKTASFTVDMSIRADEDVRGLDGELIVKKGTKFNPLRAIDLRQTILVFNPDMEGHVEWAASEGQKSLGKGLMPVYLATHIPKGSLDSPWDNLRAINAQLPGGDLKVTDRTVISRFQLKRVPSRLVQSGEVMTLTEVLISKSEEDN